MKFLANYIFLVVAFFKLFENIMNFIQSLRNLGLDVHLK